MLERFGRAVYRRRWRVVGVWVAMFVVGSLFAPRVVGILRGGGYTIGNSGSVQAYNVLHRSVGYRALTFTVVFTTHSGDTSGLFRAASLFRRHAASRYPRQITISQPVWTPDKQAVIERIYSAPREDFGAGYATTLRGMLPHGHLSGYLTGSAAVFHDMEVVSDGDLHAIEAVTLPIALLVLLVIFGSVVASLTPVLMAPIAVTLALAVIYFIGHRVDMSIFVLNTTSMLGLGVAIDYSLFMVNRFRDELALGRSLENAVGLTVATSGRAIVVSALVVSVGFYGLTLSGVSMLSSLGIGGTIVTAISLLTALTLLPAVLGILGHRINLWPVVPRRLSARDLWRRMALWVMRRPIPIIGFVALAIAILAIPAFHLRPGIPGTDILPRSVDSRAGNDLLDRHLGYANQSPVLVVMQRKSGTDSSNFRSVAFSALDHICSSPLVVGVSANPVPDSTRQIQSCQAALGSLQQAGRHRVAAAVQRAKQRRVALVAVFLHTDPSSRAAESYVTHLRGSLALPGYRVLIGGQSAGQMDFNSYLYSRFPWVILFVVVVIYVLLLIAFRSVLLPLKAVLMNIFSVLAAYGVVVFAFQDAHLATLLSFTPVGNIDSIVPVILFCVLFGISTDYEVFLLSRVQEEYLKTGSNEQSVATGLEVTGRIITSAAAVMIVVFFAFAFARLVVIKEVGLGLAVAVLVDATLIRALLVPATMRLLGRWNWWLPFRGFPVTAPPVAGPTTGHPSAAD